MGDKKKNRKLGLPTYCPSWCYDGLKGHRQAFKEGATREYAAQHMSADFSDWQQTLVNQAGSKTIREGQGGWTAQLVQDAKVGAHTFVWFEPMSTGGRRVALKLTTSEARTVAAQLVALADAEDADLS